MGIVRPAISMLALITLSFPNMVSAANICWVDQVTRVDEGVKIQLSRPAALHMRVSIPRRTNTAGQSVDIHGNPLRGDSQIGVVKDGAFILEIGDTVVLSQMPEDACSVRVEVRGSQLGVVLSAEQHLPGLQPVTQTQFVFAQ